MVICFQSNLIWLSWFLPNRFGVSPATTTKTRGAVDPSYETWTLSCLEMCNGWSVYVYIFSFYNFLYCTWGCLSEFKQVKNITLWYGVFSILNNVSASTLSPGPAGEILSLGFRLLQARRCNVTLLATNMALCILEKATSMIVAWFATSHARLLLACLLSWSTVNLFYGCCVSIF